MTCDYGLCQVIKIRIKKLICLNSWGNEIITWCLFSVRSSFLLNNHHCCMCYHRRCSLYNIYASRVNDDNVHQNTKIISCNKNIHLLSNVLRKKVRNLSLNMCFVFQSNSYNNIPTCVVNYYMFIPTGVQKQMGI